MKQYRIKGTVTYEVVTTIYAESEEEAVTKFHQQDADSIFSDADEAYMEDISATETEEVAADYHIVVTDAEYEPSEFDFEDEDLSEEELKKKREEVLKTLPTKFEFDVDDVSEDDLDYEVQSWIELETGYWVSHVEYKAVKK